MNKVVSATKIPKNPSNKIGELGNSYTGIFMDFQKIEFDLKKVYAFLPFATIITGINKQEKNDMRKISIFILRIFLE